MWKDTMTNKEVLSKLGMKRQLLKEIAVHQIKQFGCVRKQYPAEKQARMKICKNKSTYELGTSGYMIMIAGEPESSVDLLQQHKL